jgi:hypothetical protein
MMALVPGVLIGWATENVPLESLGVGGWAHSLAMVAAALVAPVAGAAALVRQVPLPAFAQVLARAEERPADRLALILGLAWVVLCVIAVEVALGLVFDPRYRDLQFAPLGAAGVPFLVLALMGARASKRRQVVETAMAAVLGPSAIYIAWHEGPANWQALWLCAVLAGLTLALLRPRGGPSLV